VILNKGAVLLVNSAFSFGENSIPGQGNYFATIRISGAKLLHQTRLSLICTTGQCVCFT
jgi:hypothetical protein